MKESLIRSLTGLAFIAVMVTGLVLHQLSFLALFSLILLLSWSELKGVSAGRIPAALGWTGSFLLVACFITVYYFLSGRLGLKAMFVPALSPLLLMLLFAIFRRRGEKNDIIFTLAGFLYLTLAFSTLNYLVLSGGSGYDPRWVLFTLGFLWMNDTMAYVSGRLFGKTLLWPVVSPSKTWEGSIGGAVFCILLAVVFVRFFPELSRIQWMGFAMVVIISGTAGDLFESWVKREAGIKDSGRILPGHGGILDRFDSFFLAIPAVCFYLINLK